MPTYIYETIRSGTDEPQRRFEVKQSISEPALTVDPETGQPVQRVITGGRGPLTTPTGGTEPTITGGCGTSCGCH